jgi:hypothetical protein
MFKLFALEGSISKELLTFGGKVLVHDNPDELGFLIKGARVVECPSYVKPEERMSIKMHPDIAHIRFPLVRSDFR